MNHVLDYKTFSETFACQYPDHIDIAHAISQLSNGIWISPGYLRLASLGISSMQPASDLRYIESIIVSDDNWGDIVIDISHKNKIIGFEFRQYAQISDWGEFVISNSKVLPGRGGMLIGDLKRGTIRKGYNVLFSGLSQIYCCEIGGIEFVDYLRPPIKTDVAITFFHLAKDFFEDDFQIAPQTALYFR